MSRAEVLDIIEDLVRQKLIEPDMDARLGYKLTPKGRNYKHVLSKLEGD